MHDLEEIKEILDKHVKNQDKEFPTDIEYLKPLFTNFEKLMDHNIEYFLAWFYLVVKNPFDMSKIFQFYHILELIGILKKRYGLNTITDKYISLCISELIYHYKENKQIIAKIYFCLNFQNQNVYDNIIENKILNKTFLEDQYKDLTTNIDEIGNSSLTKSDKNKFQTMSKHSTSETFSKNSMTQSASLSNCILHINTVEDIFFILSENCRIQITNRNNFLIFAVLKNLSKKIPHEGLKFLRMQKDDSIIAKRYILKIISFQSPENENLKYFLDLLNENNFSFGWTLSKCIVRFASKYGTDQLYRVLIQNLNHIYANENLWINSAHVLGILQLKSTINVDYLKISEKMIFYISESEKKSKNVREAGLFLLWSFFSSNKHEIQDTSHILNLLFLVAIFDEDLCCRRASTSVIFEIIGSTKHLKGKTIIDNVNFHSVFRKESCYIMAEILYANIDEFRPILFEHLDKCFRNFAAFKIDNRFFRFYVEKNSECYQKSFYEKFDSKQIEFFVSCSILKAFEEKGILYEFPKDILINISANDICKYQRISYFNKIWNAYLFVIHIFYPFNPEISQKNILFFLDKDYEPIYTRNLIRSLDDDTLNQLFLKKFNTKTNQSYIITAVIFLSKNEIIKSKFLKVLSGNDSKMKSHVFDSFLLDNFQFDKDQIKSQYINQFCRLFKVPDPVLLHKIFSDVFPDFSTYKYLTEDFFDTNEQQSTIKNHRNIFDGTDPSFLNDNFKNIATKFLVQGLEDYSISYQGDSGSYCRLSCIKLLLDHKISLITEIYYLILFFDKSKIIKTYLKDFLTKISVSDKNHIFFLSNKFFECFYLTSENLSKSKKFSEDEIHYISCIKNIHQLPLLLQLHILIAVLSTYKNGTIEIVKIIEIEIKNQFKKIEPCIEIFLQMRGRPLLLTIYFLSNIFYNYPELRHIYPKLLEKIYIFHSNENHSERIKKLLDSIVNCKNPIEYLKLE